MTLSGTTNVKHTLKVISENVALHKKDEFTRRLAQYFF